MRRSEHLWTIEILKQLKPWYVYRHTTLEDTPLPPNSSRNKAQTTRSVFFLSELRDEVRHLRDAVHILRDRLARAGLPHDDVCSTPPLPSQRDKDVSLPRSDSRPILKRQLSQTECNNLIKINQEVGAGPSAPKVCVSGKGFKKRSLILFLLFSKRF